MKKTIMIKYKRRKINNPFLFTGIIYMARNYENGKIYIGQTTGNLKRRKQAHLKEASDYKNRYFHRALRKYISLNKRYVGVNFEWSIIETIKNTSKKRLTNLLHHRETHFINYFKSFENGYNSTYGGKNPDYNPLTA